MKTPTQSAGKPAGAPPLIWDEFLPHFRRAVRLINQDEFTEADCERLTELGQHLVKELDDSIKKRPVATKLRLTETLRECLNEMPHAETMLSHKLAELEKTPALYDARFPLIREAIAAAEDTLGGLIELLGKYYPETLAGNIRTIKGPLAVRKLIVKYLPGWHKLNLDIRSEQAAAAHAPNLPAAPAVLTLAALCRAPFTPPHLNELLVRLKVISPSGTCLTNELRGKAQGPRAAFTATYRVLHRAGLLNPVPDRVWAAAFLKAYGAILKKGAISHKLTAHGTATPTAPLPFTEAVNIAREWVAEWQGR